MALHVTDTGDGIPVIWVHGFPLSSAIFARQFGIAGVRHIAPDLPGFGRSAPPDGEMTITRYAEEVLRVLDERNISRAFFAGVSMGGYICLSVARLAAERMRGLILIDTRETPDTPDGRKGRYDSIEKVKQEGIAPVVESMLPKMLSPAAPKPLVAELRRIMESCSPAGVTSALRAMAERDDSTALLPALNVRTLVLVGEEDVITPVEDAERMARAIPGATLIPLVGAGHLSNMERPAEFNDAATWFLMR